MNNIMKTQRHVLKRLQGNRPDFVIYGNIQTMTEEQVKKEIEDFRKAYPIIATHMDNIFNRKP